MPGVAASPVLLANSAGTPCPHACRSAEEFRMPGYEGQACGILPHSGSVAKPELVAEEFAITSFSAGTQERTKHDERTDKRPLSPRTRHSRAAQSGHHSDADGRPAEAWVPHPLHAGRRTA